MGGVEDVSATVVPMRRAGGVLTKQQLADHLGRSTRWIELRVREGMPSEPSTRRFPHRRFRLAEVEVWLGQGHRKTPGDRERITRLEDELGRLRATVEQLQRSVG
jgi:hypothetical protein